MGFMEKMRYHTESHDEELDFIFNQELDITKNISEKTKQSDNNFFRGFKIYKRLLRRKISMLIREKLQKNFTNILYVTINPPFNKNSQRSSVIEFLLNMRKQYPDNDIRILIPIINVKPTATITSKNLSIEMDDKDYILEKTSISFNFFLQNRKNKAILYKFPQNEQNIQIYGIYSPAFSYCKKAIELNKLQYLAPFIKSVRICTKKMFLNKKEEFNPNLIHCEHIPYFLGNEFETNLFSPIKVFQTIKDFTQIEISKIEPFWAAINLVDEFSMRKICRDSTIKKLVAQLFNLHNARRFYKMRNCIEFIYKNYYKFRKYVDKGDDIEENIIFKKLNARTLKLFPQMASENDIYYNQMTFSIKRADFWATDSKTYYIDIFEKPNISGSMYNLIQSTKEKSTYITFGKNLENYPLVDTREIYQCFTPSDFRDLRRKNKLQLLKEFSADRIKTNFIDESLFVSTNSMIIGYLDSFFEAPLLFANPSNEIFSNGIDILFNCLLKLFELHKNIQIIVAINEGLNNSYIKSWVEFLSKNKYLNGKWLFIDGEINQKKYMSAADMILLPRRTNMVSTEHFIAMHYGCVPVAARSGILNDTIDDIFDNISSGCGFKTKKSLLVNEDTNELYTNTLLKALNLYQNNPSGWNLLIKNCLTQNFDWNFETIEKYNKIYKKILDF